MFESACTLYRSHHQNILRFSSYRFPFRTNSISEPLEGNRSLLWGRKGIRGNGMISDMTDNKYIFWDGFASYFPLSQVFVWLLLLPFFPHYKLSNNTPLTMLLNSWFLGGRKILKVHIVACLNIQQIRSNIIIELKSCFWPPIKCWFKIHSAFSCCFDLIQLLRGISWSLAAKWSTIFTS